MRFCGSEAPLPRAGPLHPCLGAAASRHTSAYKAPLRSPGCQPLSVPCCPPTLLQLVGQDPGRFEDAEGDEFEEFEQQPAAAAGSSERQPNGGC